MALVDKIKIFLSTIQSNKKRLGIVILSFLLVLALPLLIFISTQSEKQDTKSKAAETTIDSLNTQILNNNTKENKAINQFLLQQRKDLMMKLSYDNPQEFLNKAMSSDLRNSFPETQRFLIEEKKEITGTLVPYHTDNFEAGIAKRGYFIQTADSTISISFDTLPSENSLESISKVSLKGYQIDNHMVIRSQDISILERSQSIESASAAPEANKKKFFVIPISFVDNRSKPYSYNLMFDKFFCEPEPGPGCRDSLRKYYETVSSRKLSINGIVTDWWESDLKSNDPCTEEGRDKMIKEAKQKYPDANLYNGIVFVLNSSCLPGLGTIGGEPSIAWIGEFDLRVLAHEIGHNLGVHHASLMKCKDDPLCLVTNEYGDQSDVMGAQLANMNGSHLRALGFKSNSIVRTISQSGTYDVYKLDGIKWPRTIRVDIQDTDTDLYIEYRGEKAGYDTSVDYNLGAGVLVYVWNGKPWDRTFVATFSSNVPVLRDGESGVISNFKVKQISHTNKYATIQITKL